MSVWGKLADAAAGLVRGGPIGPEVDGSAENEVAFTLGVIALGAKMAKADGVVTVDEVNAFKEVFKIPEGEMQNVARVFNLAKEDATGYEAYAEQLATMFKGNRKLLEDVLEGLFHIAKADQVLHPREEEFLSDVAKRFGITETEFSYIKARHLTAAKRNPYDVLGVNSSIGNDELKVTTAGWCLRTIRTGLWPAACRRSLSSPPLKKCSSCQMPQRHSGSRPIMRLAQDSLEQPN